MGVVIEMNLDSKILVTGANGFVGKNLVNTLKKLGYNNICFPYKTTDLRDEDDVIKLLVMEEPEYVFSLAAKVGGIAKNLADPYGFLLDNLKIQNNLINKSITHGIKKFLNLGSSCIYPKDYIQPLKEEYLLADKLEPTNEGYSLAKICGLKLCEYANKQQSDTKFISLMPCNLYGPNDHFDLKTSHALAALILKTWNAFQSNEKEIEVWGSGVARREWMFVEDLVDCMIWSMNNLDKTDTFLNVGTGIDISMNELAEEIFYGFYSAMDIKGFLDLKIKNDPTKPDGMMKKCLDVSNINALGWKANYSLTNGIEETVQWFLENKILW